MGLMFTSMVEWFTLAGWRRARERRRIWEMVEDLFRVGPQELRLARHWALRLAMASQVAEARVGAIMDGLAPPQRISRSQWTSEPTANALFATADELDAFLRSPAAGLRQFFTANPAASQACYAITASPDRRVTLGTRMQGEILLRDERVETMTFREHRLLEPQPTLTATRLALRRAGVRYLVTAALHHIIQEKLHRKELEETRAVLAAKRKALSLQLKSMHGLLGASRESQTALDELGTLIAELEQDIEQVDVVLGNPEDVLQEVDGFLRAPGRFLRVNPLQLRLTRDGEVLPLEATDQGWLLECTQFEPADGRPPRVMLLGCSLREDVLGGGERQETARGN